MSFEIIFLGMGLFLIGWITHIAVWGMMRIRKEILVLIFIFLIMPSAVIFWIHIGGFLDFESACGIGVLAFAISLAYVLTYPALKIQVPTLRILSVINEGGNKGVALDEILHKLCEDNELFKKKIKELESDMLITVKNDTLSLTCAGKLVASLFLGYRKLLSLPPGSG